jgi:AraC-like DNA-binding protein
LATLAQELDAAFRASSLEQGGARQLSSEMAQLTHSSSKPIPVHRVAVLRPFTNFLDDVGASIERGFRLAGLPVCALDDINNYVPSHRFWRFLVDMAHREGIHDLGFRVGQRYGAKCADPHLADLLRRSPTVYQGLLRASELANRTITNCHLGLVHSPCSRYVYFYHRPSCDAHNPAIEQIGWFGIMTLLGMVRECVGPHWQPAEIGLMTARAPGRYIRERFHATRMPLMQPYSYIALEPTLLGLTPRGHQITKSAVSSLLLDGFSTDFVGSFKQVMLSYIQERDLSIDFAAGLCDMSKRSLQRRLSAAGTRYSEVLDQVRFDAATRMLQDHGNSVADIALHLGYSDLTHFSRAFRRIAGVCPRTYRQAYLP